jgi:hypothetical protein
MTTLLRLPGLFVSFFNGDEATYSALAGRILAGALPYAGAVDHKPPGIELTYAAVYAIVGRNHLIAVRLLCIVAVAATAWCVGRIAETLDGRPEARIAGLVYVLASTWGIAGDLQQANTELLLNLPLAVAALATLRALEHVSVARGLALLAGAGALTGVAALYKYQAALAGGAWLCAVLVERARLERVLLRAAALAVGFGAVAIAYVGFFWWRGIWSEFVFWGWRFNFTYMATISASDMLLRGVRSTAAIALFWSPLVAWILVERRPRALPLAWLATMLLATAMGGRFSLHYYLMALPPLCVLAAPGVVRVRERPRARVAIAVLAAVLQLASLAVAWRWYSVKPRLAAYDAVYRAVGDELRTRARPDDRLFVWGNSAEIYYYSNLVMGTRFPFCNYHTGKIWGSPLDDADAVGTEAHIVAAAWPALLDDLERAPPRFLVDAAAGKLDRFDLHPIARYPALARFVSDHYKLLATPRDVPIYERVD